MDLTKASADELKELPGIGPARAAAIIAYREELETEMTEEGLRTTIPTVSAAVWDELFDKGHIHGVKRVQAAQTNVTSMEMVVQSLAKQLMDMQLVNKERDELVATLVLREEGVQRELADLRRGRTEMLEGVVQCLDEVITEARQ